MIKNVTPYIAILGPPLALFCLLDIIIADHVKVGLTRFVRWLASSLKNPYSVVFYFGNVIFSIVFTILILVTSGAMKSLVNQDWSFSLAIESSGLLLFGILFKIFILDYLLAIKASFVIVSSRKVNILRIRKPIRIFVIMLMFAADFTVSGMAVNGMLGYSIDWQASKISEAQKSVEASQSNEIVGKTNTPNEGDNSEESEKVNNTPNRPSFSNRLWSWVGEFFNELNFNLSNTYKRSFCFLNGNLAIYMVICATKLWPRIRPIISKSGIESKIFTIIGVMVMGLVALLLAIYSQTTT